MKYTTLGNSGLLVSELALGTMTFGSGSLPAINKVGPDQARRMVDQALDAGVNFFDTADIYADGQSEEMLGSLLGGRRKDVVIATKAGIRTGPGLVRFGLSRKHLLTACEESLARLGTDYIDLYIVHRTDPHTPLEETLETLNDLVRQGKARYIGYSNWPAWLAAKAVQMQRERGWAAFVNGQMYYSLIDRDIEHDTVPFMRASGVGLTVWSPLAGGFLSGKYTRDNLRDPDMRLGGFDFLPFDKERGFTVLETVRDIAAAHGATPARVALAWLLARPHVDSVLIGAGNPEQLADNLRAADLELRPDELARLDELTRPAPPYPNWFEEKTRDTLADHALKRRDSRAR